MKPFRFLLLTLLLASFALADQALCEPKKFGYMRIYTETPSQNINKQSYTNSKILYSENYISGLELYKINTSHKEADFVQSNVGINSKNKLLKIPEKIRKKLSKMSSINTIYKNIDADQIKIRGRGNTTAGQAKQPFKFQFSNKKDQKSILGLPSGKSWILLANFQDGPLMTDYLAFEIGKLLDMPFTHHIVPVDLYLNDIYQGVYMFTTHKELGKNRIDIGKNGQLLELTRSKGNSKDSLNKLHYIFTTPNYSLPVYIRHPAISKIAKKDSKKAEKIYKKIKDDFNSLETDIFSEDFASKYGNKLDKNSLAKLFIVHQLTKNGEINHPKSIYLHKAENGKYTFGPIWDFDWAYGGSSRREFFKHGLDSGLLGGSNPGGVFFPRFLDDPELLDIFKKEWVGFRDIKMQKLREIMREYVELLKSNGAYRRDYNKWHHLQNASRESDRKNIDEYFVDMNNWLDHREKYIDKFIIEWEDRFK